MSKIKKVCATCGSEDVSAEISAVRWDVDSQEWYISGDVCDKGHYCGNCDGECRIKDMEISPDFQERVGHWMQICFSDSIATDIVERGDRFLEEALELLQANGYTAERVNSMIAYVFNRPWGKVEQEVGGVMVTLAAYCRALHVNMHDEGERELTRINLPEVIGRIQIKQMTKPTGSALPGSG